MRADRDDDPTYTPGDGDDAHLGALAVLAIVALVAGFLAWAFWPA